MVMETKFPIFPMLIMEIDKRDRGASTSIYEAKNDERLRQTCKLTGLPKNLLLFLLT